MKRILLIALTSFIFTFCEGQYNVIVNFDNGNTPQGEWPYGNVIRVRNLLYGMTFQGGVHGYGCIFSVDTNGSNYEDRWDFSGIHDSNGTQPYGSLILFGGKLYGMTSTGGINGVGNIFSIDTTGSGYKNLWTFNQASDSNGAYPNGSLTLSGGKLYGMTKFGGINDFGNIFRIDTNGNGYKDLWDFNQAFDSNGAIPDGDLTVSGDKFYGMTYGGGINDFGNIFSIDTNGSGYKDLWDFDQAFTLNGAKPYGSLTLSAGKLYGMTFGGGLNEEGNIFSIDTNGSGYKDLWNFNPANDSNGAKPYGSLTLLGSKLYGMTFSGGMHDSGSIFRIDTNGSGYKDMFNFRGSDGAFPYGSLTLSGDVLYGMTQGGGSGYGVVFSIDTNAVAGINDISPTTASIKAYPNPSSGVFTLRVESEKLKAESGMIGVYNVLGEKVYSQLSTLNSQLSIDLSNQPSGIYFYRVIAEDGGLEGEGKLIIQK